MICCYEPFESSDRNFQIGNLYSNYKEEDVFVRVYVSVIMCVCVYVYNIICVLLGCGSQSVFGYLGLCILYMLVREFMCLA